MGLGQRREVGKEPPSGGACPESNGRGDHLPMWQALPGRSRSQLLCLLFPFPRLLSPSRRASLLLQTPHASACIAFVDGTLDTLTHPHPHMNAHAHAPTVMAVYGEGPATDWSNLLCECFSFPYGYSVCTRTHQGSLATTYRHGAILGVSNGRLARCSTQRQYRDEIYRAKRHYYQACRSKVAGLATSSMHPSYS